MITIGHTRADGTLIGGSVKHDGVWELLRDLRDGWGCSRNIGIYLRRSRDQAAKTGLIDRAAAALRAAGHDVTVTVDDDTRRTVADIEADRAVRADARTERLDGRAESRGAQAAADYTQARRMSAAIPFGQPAMPDHHSYSRDMNYRAKMGRTYDRAFEGLRDAAELTRRAGAAAANQSHRESVPATLRRIERLEAERRSWQRAADGEPGSHTPRHGETGAYMPAEGRHLEQVKEQLAELDEQLTYWRGHVAAAEQAGTKVWSKADFERDDYALSRGTWYQVQRVNPKSLTVMWGTNTHLLPAVTRDNVRHALGPSTRTGTIGYDDIRGHMTPAQMTAHLAALPGPHDEGESGG